MEKVTPEMLRAWADEELSPERNAEINALLAADIELAAKAAVSVDTLSALENGRPVTTQTLAQVLAALGYGEALANVLPLPVVSPIEMQKLEGKQRQRVR